MEGGRGGAVEISEGMLHGNDVIFKVVREFNGNKFEQNYKGSLSGDELKLTVEVGVAAARVPRNWPSSACSKRPR